MSAVGAMMSAVADEPSSVVSSCWSAMAVS